MSKAKHTGKNKSASIMRLVAIAATMGTTAAVASTSSEHVKPRPPALADDVVLGSAARSHLGKLMPAAYTIRRAAATAAPAFTTGPSVPAVTRNADGRLQMFITDGNGAVWTRSQAGPGQNTWTSWAQLDGTMRTVAAATNNDGRIELFALDYSGNIYHRAQTAPGAATYTPWIHLDGQATTIALAHNADGRLEAIVTNPNDHVYRSFQHSPGSLQWTGWQGFPVQQLHNVTAETDSNGRITIVGVDATGTIYSARQTAVNTDTWTAWTVLTGKLVKASLTRYVDGRLELFGVNGADQIWHSRETAPGSGIWTGWTQMTGASGNIAAAANLDGSIELFTVDTAGTISHQWEPAGTSTWSGWALMPAPVAHGITFTADHYGQYVQHIDPFSLHIPLFNEVVSAVFGQTPAFAEHIAGQLIGPVGDFMEYIAPFDRSFPAFNEMRPGETIHLDAFDLEKPVFDQTGFYQYGDGDTESPFLEGDAFFDQTDNFDRIIQNIPFTQATPPFNEAFFQTQPFGQGGTFNQAPPFSQGSPFAQAFSQADPFGQVFPQDSPFQELFNEGGGGGGGFDQFGDFSRHVEN